MAQTDSELQIKIKEQDQNFDEIVKLGFHEGPVSKTIINRINITSAISSFQRKLDQGLSIKLQGSFFQTASLILKKKLLILGIDVKEYYENFKKQNVTQIKRKVDPNRPKKQRRKINKDGKEIEDGQDDGQINQDDNISIGEISDSAQNAIDNPRHLARPPQIDLQPETPIKNIRDEIDSQAETNQITGEKSNFKSFLEDSKSRNLNDLSSKNSGINTPNHELNFDYNQYQGMDFMNPLQDGLDTFQSNQKEKKNLTTQDIDEYIKDTKYIERDQESLEEEQIKQRKILKNKSNSKNKNNNQGAVGNVRIKKHKQILDDQIEEIDNVRGEVDGQDVDENAYEMEIQQLIQMEDNLNQLKIEKEIEQNQIEVLQMMKRYLIQ
ncbi:hypothetical protein PPERSA_08571 [Pseudocohnilembus persalinus]|uniref:Uncharacterized protein n=1 Tax=Pseudocohnilembus persalinus TaxID=266149 RepID=A0A0V0R7L7_PSEPJ|nr:hypothetical protein PPERSA_08571 [Pseudocohnilembus persalinus]|eukprot:KRX10168.1 hypothetical protein PPERSA_08571 [Pseudocohnilembus persalinus]